MKRFTLFALLSLVCSWVYADVLTLKSGHPDTYVVKKGDTLWDISAMFLKDPWRWPKLWGANPQIANPHLIYPGDRLTLVFIDGEPRLVNKPFVRSSPSGQIKSKGDAIPLVDLSLIEQYLVQNRIVDPEWLQQQPMVVGGENPAKRHVAGDIIYIKGNVPKGTKLGLYQPGRKFVDQDSGDSLGQEAILTATGRVTESGDISKVLLLNNFRETKAGFRAFSVEDDAFMSAYLMPRAGTVADAKVLASELDIREMGKFDIAYIDRGSKDGVETGQVFTIFKPGDKVVIGNDGVPVLPNEQSAYDKMLGAMDSDDVLKLPNLYRGQLMVFKVFDKTSMGLILVDKRPVRVGDILTKPVTILQGE
ncbi:LysM peptidoglycan-binding domain-containing protein [Shewanella yunxiaonensis]|uniref:LysM peptidoglycan-binding domain-containing protein n=1 Tax=Shewanella yunxiaonensis TaxID=2829809 RepID=A0ABX7YT15_9GAMM|nr:LysM domain-containing protein [Shewanella yunxiaonensis]QUN05943.1 LysM peptidoglycan-binding domain-containing protein [Shewanella yunxiaonensis]